MSEPKRSDEARRFYDRAAVTMPDLSLLNYGYASSSDRAEAGSQDEGFCVEMYRHVGSPDLNGKEVLEVSSGRGGGAAAVMRLYAPSRLVGVDLSAANVRLAQERFGRIEGLGFREGSADALDFPDRSFDGVINVEASHLYDHPERFFAEVFRVLRPGGRFCYADLFWANSDPTADLRDAGLEILSSEDITPNVLRALELDSARREGLMRAHLPPAGWQDFRDWSGIPGFRAYNRFASGEWVYRAFQAERLTARPSLMVW